MLRTHSEYDFAGTTILLESETGDTTACVDSLVVKVNGEPAPITAKYWCGHHISKVVTPAGTLELPSCARNSPPQPTWTPA
jgi:hypothetical protein